MSRMIHTKSVNTISFDLIVRWLLNENTC